MRGEAKEGLERPLGTHGRLRYSSLRMVSEKDREHFRRLAEIEAELNQEALHACAARPPGVNIALGLELGEFAAAFGGDVSRPDEVAPITLWHRRSQNPIAR